MHPSLHVLWQRAFYEHEADDMIVPERVGQRRCELEEFPERRCLRFLFARGFVLHTALRFKSSLREAPNGDRFPSLTRLPV